MQEVIKEIVKRIEKMKKEEKVFVAYHFDVDGCASASIMWRILQKIGVMADFSPVTRGFEQIAVDRIRKSNPTKVLLVDYVPGDDFAGFLEKYQTEIIDHHTHEKHLEKFDYFTSVDYNVHFSVSYLLSLAAKELKIKDVAWLGEAGAFWDKCLEGTEFFKENVYKDEIDNMLPFNLIISLTQTKGSEKLFQTFNESSSINEAIEKIKAIDDYKRAKEIFDSELREIKFTKKSYSDVMLNIYWVKTKFKHIRIYVDYITYTTSGTHVFVLDENIRFKLSFRTSLDINLEKIIKELAQEDKNFGGGGHAQACGAMLKNENVEELLNNFIKKYRAAMLT
jgi:single-stranded DNA-specific DHH superfamily exonuclease